MAADFAANLRANFGVGTLALARTQANRTGMDRAAEIMKPSLIVEALNQYVIGQDDAKKIVAVAVYSHFKKLARSRRSTVPIAKSNVLLVGASGTGKTLMCETLSRILEVPFVTAEATSLA